MGKNKDKAIELFVQGYNCAQAVFGAFAEDFGLEPEVALKISAPFGAGMGKLRETCGAASGMFMVLGLKDGYAYSSAKEEKAELYEKVQMLANKFKEKNCTLICRELLKNVKTTGGHIPEDRTKEYYKTRPCVKFVADAAEILEEYLNQN